MKHALSFALTLTFVGCAHPYVVPPTAPTPDAPANYELRDAFAIYEADHEVDVTLHLPPLPVGFEVAPGGSEGPHAFVRATWANRERLRAFTTAMSVPRGDRIMVGPSLNSSVVRTYVVKAIPILSARDVRGAIAHTISGDDSEWGVGMTFEPEALKDLKVALGEGGKRFRIVVEGMVAPDPFELVTDWTYTDGPHFHGAPSTTMIDCHDHSAVITLERLGSLSSRQRAEALARRLPGYANAYECETIQLFHRGPAH